MPSTGSGKVAAFISYKRGSAHYEIEPLSEYLAAQMSSRLCPGAVPYDMDFYHETGQQMPAFYR